MPHPQAHEVPPSCTPGCLSLPQRMPTDAEHGTIASMVHSLLWAPLPYTLLKVLQIAHCETTHGDNTWT